MSINRECPLSPTRQRCNLSLCMFWRVIYTDAAGGHSDCVIVSAMLSYIINGPESKADSK
jgi:hypothetical protein